MTIAVLLLGRVRAKALVLNDPAYRRLCSIEPGHNVRVWTGKRSLSLGSDVITFQTGEWALIRTFSPYPASVYAPQIGP